MRSTCWKSAPSPPPCRKSPKQSGNDKKTELPVVVKNDDKEVIITGNADPASTVSSSIPKSKG
ncbi:MAG: hypothetical protein R2688_09565 [Fimbriimonadaceae bacterium]